MATTQPPQVPHVPYVPPGPTGSPAAPPHALGHLFASFVGTAIVMGVQFGLPVTPEQQNAILSFVITGWAFGSAFYVVARAARRPTAPTAGGDGGQE